MSDFCIGVLQGTASGPPKSLTYTFSDGRVESTELKYSGPQYELHLDGHGPQEVYITIMQDSKRGVTTKSDTSVTDW